MTTLGSTDALGSTDGLVMHDIAVYAQPGNHEFRRTDYPWLVMVGLIAQGGDELLQAKGVDLAGRPGYVIVELWGYPDGLIDDVLDAVRRFRTSRVYPYEQLAGRYPANLVLYVMNALSDAGILEYGVSLRTAWVCDYEPDIAERIAAFKATWTAPAAP